MHFPYNFEAQSKDPQSQVKHPLQQSNLLVFSLMNDNISKDRGAESKDQFLVI